MRREMSLGSYLALKLRLCCFKTLNKCYHIKRPKCVGNCNISRSISHDYEQVHNTTDGETDSGMFKNLTYTEQETSKPGQLNSYSQVMRNNEELLASHLRSNNSRQHSESSDNDTSHLVTSQVIIQETDMIEMMTHL